LKIKSAAVTSRSSIEELVKYLSVVFRLALTNGTAKPAATSPPISTADRTFSAPDYVVFSISLAIPLFIGLFFFLWDLRHKKGTTQNFLLGERSINFIAVALSILASVLNGIFVIGLPAEIHYYGAMMLMKVVGIFICVVVTSHIYVRKYQGMKLTSAYEVGYSQC